MKEKFNQNTSNLYESLRLNEYLVERNYSSKELEDIVKAQFYYFYYKIKIGDNLPECSFLNLKDRNLLKIKNKIISFKKNLLPLFKNDKDSFEKTILFLLLSLNSRYNSTSVNEKKTKI